jgi:hypothetical protein
MIRMGFLLFLAALGAAIGLLVLLGFPLGAIVGNEGVGLLFKATLIGALPPALVMWLIGWRSRTIRWDVPTGFEDKASEGDADWIEDLRDGLLGVSREPPRGDDLQGGGAQVSGGNREGARRERPR